MQEVETTRQQFSQDPKWSIKFRLLEAEILVTEGKSQESRAQLNIEIPSSAEFVDDQVRKNMILGIAELRLGNAASAQQNLIAADRLCENSLCPSRGEVARARGVYEVENGNLKNAEDFFRKSSEIARQVGDHFLEATALLNLGVVSLQQEHYDEAVDQFNASERAAESIGAAQLEEKALGNLGWAHFKLGDFDQALTLFPQAIQKASALGFVIDQVEWLNTLGLVYADTNQFSKAEENFKQSLALANKIQNNAEILGANTTLAQFYIHTGNVSEADFYAKQTIELANQRKDGNARLYGSLVEGLIAIRKSETQEAQKIFHEIIRDPQCDTSLRWETERELASSYAAENKTAQADQEYRKALGDFESVRDLLHADESKLPFITNASQIYDDYIHFLVRQGNINQALAVADYSRAQTLAEGLGLLPKGAKNFSPALNAAEAARKSDANILFYWLGEQESYLWTVHLGKINLFTLPKKSEIEAAVEKHRQSVTSSQDVLRDASSQDRLYQFLIAPAQEMIHAGSRVVVIPDGVLNNLNFETIVVPGGNVSGAAIPSGKPHYWIEDVTVMNASSIRLLASSRTATRNASPKMLLIGDPIVPSPEYGALPSAAIEIQKLQSHFSPTQLTIYTRQQATAGAYLTGNPEQFSYIHFTAHGTASELTPLDSAIVLSADSKETDSFKLYAREIIQHPLHAQLVTISTCYGAGSRAYTGEGLVGLSWAFLRAGAHHVIGALWDVSDASTAQLMDTMYGQLKQGKSPEVALREAKLSLLHSDGVFRKPFYWAPFQLYVGQ
ncbi:MAG TPA: CHAT domain-containing protein [Terriglobales bacterium]